MTNHRHTRNRFRLFPLSVLVFFFSLLISTGCEKNNTPVADFVTIKDAQWKYGDTLFFNVNGDTLPDPLRDVQLILRHTTEYPFANLWLELTYDTPDSIASDTFNVTIADNYGKLLGKGTGPVLTLTDTLRLRSLPAPDATFALRHVMRVETLPEIEQIGISYLPSLSTND